MPADATWPAVLERTLGVRGDNAGVPGYSSVQMVGRLRRYLPLLQPRVVVMVLSPTWDLGRCASPFVYKGGYIVGQGYADRLILLDGNLYLRETKLPVLGTATAPVTVPPTPTTVRAGRAPSDTARRGPRRYPAHPPQEPPAPSAARARARP